MFTLLLTGCLPDLDVVHEWNDGTPASTPVLPTPPSPPSPPDTSDTGDTGDTVPPVLEGKLVIDATSYETWVVLELDPYPYYVALDTPGWDLRIRRFEVALNGGITGDGGVAAAFVPDVTLDTLTTLPVDGYLEDAPDVDDDDDDVPEYALGGWYHYDFVTHVLTPIAGVYVIRTTDGHHIGLEITGYYDAAGTSGFVAVDWMTLEHL